MLFLFFMVKPGILSGQDAGYSNTIPTSREYRLAGDISSWMVYIDPDDGRVLIYVSDYHAPQTLVLKRSGLEKLLRALEEEN